VFQFRYYAPFIGNWVSPDPAGEVDGPNRYWYARNNPATLIDPYGLQATVDEAPSVDPDVTYTFPDDHVIGRRPQRPSAGDEPGPGEAETSPSLPSSPTPPQVSSGSESAPETSAEAQEPESRVLSYDEVVEWLEEQYGADTSELPPVSPSGDEQRTPGGRTSESDYDVDEIIEQWRRRPPAAEQRVGPDTSGDYSFSTGPEGVPYCNYQCHPNSITPPLSPPSEREQNAVELARLAAQIQADINAANAAIDELEEAREDTSANADTRLQLARLNAVDTSALVRERWGNYAYGELVRGGYGSTEGPRFSNSLLRTLRESPETQGLQDEINEAFDAELRRIGGLNRVELLIGLISEGYFGGGGAGLYARGGRAALSNQARRLLAQLRRRSAGTLPRSALRRGADAPHVEGAAPEAGIDPTDFVSPSPTQRAQALQDGLTVRQGTGDGLRIARIGEDRELQELVELAREHPHLEIVQQARLYARADDGTFFVARDPATPAGSGEGTRVLDFVLVDHSGSVPRALRAIEVTGPNVDKASQLAREARIRAAGGRYVRARNGFVEVPASVVSRRTSGRNTL